MLYALTVGWSCCVLINHFVLCFAHVITVLLYHICYAVVSAPISSDLVYSLYVHGQSFLCLCEKHNCHVGRKMDNLLNLFSLTMKQDIDCHCTH